LPPSHSQNPFRKLAAAVVAIATIGTLLGATARAEDGPSYSLRIDRYDPVLPVPGVAVMVIHGGGWWTGSPDGAATVCQAVVAQLNLTCFAPDYTHSGSAPFPAANLDLISAVSYVHTLGFVRIGAVGLSAGGNLAGWLASHHFVDVAATWSAPADLTTLHDWDPPGHPGTLGVVHSFAPNATDRRNASPALKKIGVPLLVVNSDHELIPLGQARELYRAATGARHLTILPGTAHAAAYTAIELPETIAWLDTYL
jgi:acetyl esterase/lipase